MRRVVCFALTNYAYGLVCSVWVASSVAAGSPSEVAWACCQAMYFLLGGAVLLIGLERSWRSSWQHARTGAAANQCAGTALMAWMLRDAVVAAHVASLPSKLSTSAVLLLTGSLFSPVSEDEGRKEVVGQAAQALVMGTVLSEQYV